jgi:hypothetical protein
MMRARVAVAASLLAGLLSIHAATAANIVQNGSFESGGFSANLCDTYMQLPNGSTTIGGWTVATSANNIAWGNSPSCDTPPNNAADGSFYVDLTGQGSESPDGALTQELTVVDGVVYQFSIALFAANDDGVVVTVGGDAVALLPGASFTVGGTEWVRHSGSFVGDPLDALLVVQRDDNNPGAQFVFIDDVRVTATPEPAGLALLLAGAVAFAALRRRR